MLTTSTDESLLALGQISRLSEGSSVPVVSRWLGPRNRTLLEVVSMVVTWWIVPFVPSEQTQLLKNNVM